MDQVPCEGWWEQEGFGRQPMWQLLIGFDGHRLNGSGIDVVGQFTMQGKCDQGRLVIIKRYPGSHEIEYYGQTDGEGSFYGEWGWAGYIGGKWSIKFGHIASAQDAEIQDITESLLPPVDAPDDRPME